MKTWIEDAGVLVLIVVLVPLAIVVVGTPIALLARVLLAIAHRM